MFTCAPHTGENEEFFPEVRFREITHILVRHLPPRYPSLPTAPPGGCRCAHLTDSEVCAHSLRFLCVRQTARPKAQGTLFLHPQTALR